VFLAAAVPARAGQRVLDAGAGMGVAGLCLLARVPGIELTAVEIDPELATLAAGNAARNSFVQHVTVVTANVTSPGKVLRAAGLDAGGYQHVIANPPFHDEGSVRAAPDAARAAAHVIGRNGLAAWVRFFAAMAAPDGLLTLIHRPECLDELLALLDGRFGDVAVFPLFPKRDEPATRIIVQAKKGSRAGISLLQGLVLHDEDGRYTDEAEAVLRNGEGLHLRPAKEKGRRLGG